MLELSKIYINIDKNDLKKSDIWKLEELINYHSDLYYNKQEPIISDYEYDIIYSKLKYLEEKFSIVSKKSDIVWSEILESSFEKVKHSRPMISLDNTYNEEDLRDFDQRVFKNIGYEIDSLEYCLEYKFDWLWVELIYQNWDFKQAITRWNGLEWEDVTENVRQISNIPKTISYKDHLEVRWEVVMPISSFDKLNDFAKKNNQKVFSNPRNAASWSLRVKDISVTKSRELKFFAYDLANFDEFVENEAKESYFDVIKDLESLWFEISSYFKKFSWIDDLINEIIWNDKIKSWIDFEVDGLVLKVNNISLWSDIWWTQHHPRYAIAYKFPAEILTTKILSVEHSVWRTWTITPVANLEPINIWWAIIKRATLHNYEEVENLDVRIGDSVFIKRAGEVIPKIISVVQVWDRSNLEKIQVPTTCPSCWTEVLKDDWKVRFYCPNTLDCPAQHSEKLVFAVGKWWFNIDGLWEKQIELFIDNWLINNLVDIFKLEDKKDIILWFEWFKEKSVSNLLNGINNAKKMDISTFLTAVWIPWVWKKTAKVISKYFKNKDDLINFSITIDELSSLQDIWPELSKNIVNYFSDENHKKYLNELSNILEITYFKEKEIIWNSLFSCKKVCITWSFEENWKKISRDDLVKELETFGWEFVSSVSKNTDYLLAWEKAGSKKEKAEKLWVSIIDLSFFRENINN